MVSVIDGMKSGMVDAINVRTHVPRWGIIDKHEPPGDFPARTWP